MNAEMGIPTAIEGIKPEDIPLMADRAFKEACPLYPVPEILDRPQLEELYRMIAG